MDFLLWTLGWWATGIIANFAFVVYLGGLAFARENWRWIFWLGVFGPFLFLGYLMFFLEETDWIRNFRDNLENHKASRKKN